MLRARFCLTLGAIICLAPTLSAQWLYHRKDAAFAQVAAGGNIETVIVLTNRGTFPYSGVILFSFDSDGKPWNPMVNGERIENGLYEFQVDVDQVLVLRIDDPASPNAQGGAAVIVSHDLVPDNFLECNLTYYLRSKGTVTDSIGILPGDEFYLASLPFEDFYRIALAVADTRIADPDHAPPGENRVVLSLLDSTGEMVASKEVFLRVGGHTAKFLSEYFGDAFAGSPSATGKVEIAAEYPVAVTALTLTGAELSSLPLQAAPVGYTVRLDHEDGTELEGFASLWAEGFFVRGYLVITQKDGIELEDQFVTLVNGQLIDGLLDLSFYAETRNFWGTDRPNQSATMYLFHPQFTFWDEELTGDYTLTLLGDSMVETGAFTLTRTTP